MSSAEKVDIINVSAAQNDNLNLQIDQMSLEDGWKRYLSRAVRDKFHKPTVIAGNIRTPQVAEDILASGDADLIAIGRGLIAEPEWVQKVQGGKERLMRKCISCNIGCADHRIARSRPLRCSINPDIIHGDAYKMRRVNRDTNVVVIGAGTAGWKPPAPRRKLVAIPAAGSEKPRRRPRQRNLPPAGEKRIADFPQFMKNRIASLDNLMLQIGKRADVASVSALRPHLIVNATGSTPLLPPIEGLRENIDVENGKIFSITGMIDNLAKFTDIKGKRIAVVGAGAVGLDVIEYFTARGAQAVLIEMQDAAGRDLDIITKMPC